MRTLNLLVAILFVSGLLACKLESRLEGQYSVSNPDENLPILEPENPPSPPAPPSGPNTAPTAVADALSIPVTNQLRFDPLANDSDIDGDTISVIGVVDGSKGTTTLNGDGTITYDPTPGSTGADSFTYTLEDGRGETSQGTVKVFIASADNSFNMCGTLRESSAISGTLFDEGGPAGNYIKNQNCAFLIDPGFAATVELEFVSFAIENGYDHFKIYEGRSDSGTLVADLTGSPGLPITYSISNAAYFVFTSDHGGSGPGFEMNWAATPSSFSLAAATNKDFVYQTNQAIVSEVVNFGSATNLSYSLISGQGYVGALSPQNLFSFMTPATPGAMTIRVTDSGSASSVDIPLVVAATHNICSEPTSAENAGFIVDSGGETGNYGNNESCGFLIQPPAASSVNLEVTYVDVEGGYDKIKVFDGLDDTATQIGSDVSGLSRGTFASTGNAMYVKFTSDFGATRSGFKLRWVAN